MSIHEFYFLLFVKKISQQSNLLLLLARSVTLFWALCSVRVVFSTKGDGLLIKTSTY